MDDLGANNRNGTTNEDRTNFFEDVPVSALERTLYLEADRMGFLAAQINEAMLERERGVVQNEKRQGENQPYGRVFDTIVERMFPASHPYSWPTIGSMEDLDAASLEDVKAWYAAYYGPNNCVLSLAGDITPERALELVKKYFGGIAPGPPIDRLERWVPRLDANIRDQMQDRVPQARIYRAYHLPPWRDPDVQRLELLAGVLSGSRSARLDRPLVYQQELATAVSADVYPSELSSLLVITATVRPGVDPAAVEQRIDRIVGRPAAAGPVRRRAAARPQPHPRELHARRRTPGRFRRTLRHPRAEHDLRRAAGRLPRSARAPRHCHRRRGTRRRPHAGSGRRITRSLSRRSRRWRRARRRSIARCCRRLPIRPTSPSRRCSARSSPTASGVMLLERHSMPLVNVSLAVDAGYAADSAEKAGAASLALDLLDDGTATRDTFRIADELDALGARITTASSLDLSFVRLQALPRHLAPSLSLFADVILNPSFPADMVELAKRRRLAQIAQEQANPVPAVLRVVPALLFGAGHAYGNPLTGSGYEKTVSALMRDDLVKWHRAWFHPNNATIIVTGDTTMAALLPELERAFSAWKPGPAPSKQIQAVPATTGKRVFLIDRPGAPQSVIVAAHVSAAGGQPEDLAIDTVMRNFGGIATSRLNRNLRLDKHWSYGTTALLQDARGQRPFIVIAPVQTDKTKESIGEIVKELDGIAGERPIRGEEFASIMRTQTLGLPGRWATLAALETAATQLLNYHYPDDYFSTYARRVRALGEAHLDAAARKFIRPSEVIWIVVGDLAQVEKGVRELNLGDVAQLDGDGQPMGTN